LFTVCLYALLPWGIPTKRSHKLIDQGSTGVKKQSPKREITSWGNMCWTTSIDVFAVWAVAPSCWNHIFLIFTWRLRSSGCRMYSLGIRREYIYIYIYIYTFTEAGCNNVRASLWHSC
jgi:hypothetical protein